VAKHTDRCNAKLRAVSRVCVLC